MATIASQGRGCPGSHSSLTARYSATGARHAHSLIQQQPLLRRRQRRRLLLANTTAGTATDHTQPSSPPPGGAASQPTATPSVQDVVDAALDASSFAGVLEQLSERGSGCTEAHVVAAWLAQRRAMSLRRALASRSAKRRQQAERILQLLEELTRQQLRAFTPDQLGFVFRCYVLVGGSYKPLLHSLQQVASSWRADDYSAAGFAELAWALASSRRQLSPACCDLLRSSLGIADSNPQQQRRQQQQQNEQAGDDAQQTPTEAPDAAGAPQQQQQRRQRQQGRDWQAWFADTPPGKVVPLLWAAARLGYPPCEGCMQAAAAVLLKKGHLAALTPKSLITLLWCLATLRAADQPQLVQAISRELARRLEADQPEQLQPQPQPYSQQQQVQAEQWQGVETAAEGTAAAAAGAAAAAASVRAGSPDILDSVDDELAGGASRGEALGLDAGSHGADEPAHGDGGSGSDGEEASSRRRRRRSSSASSGGIRNEMLQVEESSHQEELHTGQLSTAVWACGQLRHADPDLLQLTAALLLDRVKEMTPGDISRVLWGYAQVSFCHTPLLNAIVGHLQQPEVLPAFSVRQLAMTTYAWATLDFYPGQYCLDCVADACLAIRERFDPRSLSHVLWNMSRLGYVDELFYQAFVPVILPNIEQYGPAELADVARVYSRYGLNPGEHGQAVQGGQEQEEGAAEGSEEGGALFDAIAAQTVRRIHEADVQDVLRIMTAFHQMGLQPDELLTAVEGWANQRLRKLPPQALSLAVWRFARMGSSSPKLLETAAGCAEQQLKAFTPAQLAKVAWSFAKLRWPTPRVLRHAGAQLTAHTAAFGDKEASNVLWALASEGERLPAESLNTIATNLQPRLKAFGPQSLANIAWAYATLGHTPPPPFLQLLGEAALRQLRAFEPQGLSLLVWALASLGCRQNKLFSQIVKLCEQPGMLRGFEGQHLSNLLWGLCRTGFKPSQEFLDAVALEAELRVCDFKPQELFNIVWAFSQLGHRPVRLFDAIAEEVVPRAFAFTPQELSGTLWALAKQQHATHAVVPLLSAVEHEVSARAPAFEDRHLAILPWCYGQLGHVPTPAALHTLLAAMQERLPRLEGRTLNTFVAGLAAVEQLRRTQWQQAQKHGQQQGQQPVQRPRRPAAADTPASAAGEQEAEPEPLVPAALVTQLVERASQVLPQLQPFEFAQLVHSFALLGSRQAAQRFLAEPDAVAAGMMEAAAKRAPLPAAMQLLSSMAQWRCYPRRPFTALSTRLRLMRPKYRFTPAALVTLGQALQHMSKHKRACLHLRPDLEAAALEAAALAAQGALLGGSSSAAGCDDGDQASPDSEGKQQQQQQRQPQQNCE